MNKVKRVLLVLLILASSFTMSSCWNYREIERLAIVAGLAIDIDKDGQYLITAEIANPQPGAKGTTIAPEYVQAKGKTIFDAAREIISTTGKRLYWSHTKVYIISLAVARKDVLSVLDWITRDSETREDAWIILAAEKRAYDIFNAKPVMESVISYQLDDSLRSQKAISRFPSVELYKFINETEAGAHAAILPLVTVKTVANKSSIHIHDTAIIFKGKLIGLLNEEESKALLAIRNELKGGLYVVKNVEGTNINVTLEIFKNKTKVKPVYQNGKLVMQIRVDPTVDIAEITGGRDYISKKGRAILAAEDEEEMKANILKVIKKAQEEYNADIFGFGTKIKRDMPKVWKQIEPNWKEFFPSLEVSVIVKLNIRGSATTRQPLQLKD